MICPTTQEELQAFVEAAIPVFLDYLRTHQTAIEQVELAQVATGINSFPATQTLGGVTKTVRVPLSLLKDPLDDAAEYAEEQGDYAAAQTALLQDVIDEFISVATDGYAYAGIATPSTTPSTGKLFYVATQAGTYINFSNLVVTQGINIIRKVNNTWIVEQVMGTDGTVFDLSTYNAVNGTPARYADLEAALTALNSLPAAYKKGGMSIKFVQSSDNNYVKFFCTANEFTTDVTKWQGVDDTPTIDSKNIPDSNGTFRMIHDATTILIDKASVAGSWWNNNKTEKATLELDTSGHNGIWHLLAQSAQGSAIRMNLTSLENGKVYNISFDVSYNSGARIARLNGSASNVASAYQFYDYYSGKAVYIKSGHVELNVQKTSGWGWLYINYGGIDTLTYPLDVTISNFSLTEVVGVKDIVPKAVLFESQALTEQEKKQARANLGFGNGDIDTSLVIGSMNLITNDVIAQEIGGEFIRGSAVLSADSSTNIIPMQSIPTIKSGTTLRFNTDGFPDKITGAYLYINNSDTRLFHITESTKDYTCETDITKLRVSVPSAEVKTGAAGSEIYISVEVKGIADNINDVYNDFIKSVIEYNATYQNGVSYTNKATARASVPVKYQRAGMKLTYICNGVWITEQFIGNSWSVDDINWNNIGIYSINGDNLYDWRSARDHMAIGTQSGNYGKITNTSSDYFVTGYIPVDPTICNRVMSPVQPYRVALYDANKTILENGVKYDAASMRTSVDITGASYIVVCWSFTDFEKDRLTRYVFYANSSDIPIHTMIDGKRIGFSDPQYITKNDIIGFATNKPNDEYTSSFSFIINKGNQGYKNMIVICNAMYENTVDDSVPTIKFIYRYNSQNSPITTIEYTIGQKDYMEERQWRLPAFPHACYLLVIVTIPSNVTLYIKDFYNTYSNEINRNCKAYKLDGHRNGNVLSGFMNIAKLGYPTCITIPKRTSDGVWVCFHDENIGTQLKDADGHTPAQNHPEITGSVGIWDLTYTELMTYTYAAAYDGTKNKVPTLEEFFGICARTGMSPMLSLHPAPTTQEYGEIKALAIKMGVLSQLELKPLSTLSEYVNTPYSVFGDEIKSYIIQASSITTANAISRLDALNADLTKVTLGAEISGNALTVEAVEAIRNAGYIVSTANPDQNAEFYRYWMSKGVTEFTDDYNFSYGLNW